MTDLDVIPRLSIDEIIAGGLSELMQAGFRISDRWVAVMRAVRAVEALRAAEGEVARTLARLDAIAADAAAEHAGSHLQGDAHSGELRALASEVAVATAQNARGLHARIAEAGALARSLPALTELHREGVLALAHLRAAERAAANLVGEAANGEQLRDVFERRLIDEAMVARARAAGAPIIVGTALTAREFGRLAARIVAELAPAKVVDDHERAMRERRVHAEEWTAGMSALTVIGPTVLVEAAIDRVQRGARALDGDDPRTMAQREADLAFHLLLGGEVDGGDAHAAVNRIRPVVHITVPALALAGREEAGPAMLDDEHPVPIDVAAQLCGAASLWTRVLTDPLRGTPIAADTYTPGRELRRAIEARDRTCRAPGCTVPARRCDIDHTIEWRRGGTTVPENLACLCRYHHRMREFGWRLAQPAPGVLEWKSPSGSVYRTTPTRITSLGASPPGAAPEPDEEAPPF